MALYNVVGDDGQTYELEGPSGYTQEQMREVLRAKNMGMPKAPKTEEKPSEDAIRAARLQRMADAANYDSYDILDEFEEFGKGIGRGAVNMGELAAKGVAEGLDADGETLETISSIAESARSPFTQDAGPGGDTYVGGVLGEGLGSIVPMGAMAMLGPLGWGAAGATAVAAGAGEATTRAREAGATEEEIDQAFLPGAGVGALELFPLSRILGRAGKEVINNAWKRYGKAFAEEGGQEALSAVAQNMIEEQIYNPEADLVNLDVLKEAGVGGTVGMILQGLADLALKGKRAGTPDAEPTTEEPVAPTATDMSPNVPEVPTTPDTPTVTTDINNTPEIDQSVLDAADEVSLGEQTPEEIEAAKANIGAEKRAQVEAARERIKTIAEGKEAEPKPEQKLTREQVIEKTLTDNQIGNASVMMPIIEDELGRAGYDPKISANEVMTVLQNIKRNADQPKAPTPKGTAQPQPATPAQEVVQPTEQAPEQVATPKQEDMAQPKPAAPEIPEQQQAVEPTTPEQPPVESTQQEQAPATNLRTDIFNRLLENSRANTPKGFSTAVQRRLKASGQEPLTDGEKVELTQKFNEKRGIADDGAQPTTPDGQGVGASPSDMQSDTVVGGGVDNNIDATVSDPANGGGLGQGDGVPSGPRGGKNGGRRALGIKTVKEPKPKPPTKAKVAETKASIAKRKQEATKARKPQGTARRILRDEAKLRERTFTEAEQQNRKSMEDRNTRWWEKESKRQAKAEGAANPTERTRAIQRLDTKRQSYTFMAEVDPLSNADYLRIVSLREGAQRPQKKAKKGTPEYSDQAKAQRMYDDVRTFFSANERPIDSLILLAHQLENQSTWAKTSTPVSATRAGEWVMKNLSPEGKATLEMLRGEVRGMNRRGDAFSEKALEQEIKLEKQNKELASQVNREGWTAAYDKARAERKPVQDKLEKLVYDPSEATANNGYVTEAEKLDLSNDKAIDDFLANLNDGDMDAYANVIRDNVYGELGATMHPHAIQKLHDGDLRGGLEMLANTTGDKFIAKVARRLADTMAMSDTKIVVASDLSKLVPGRAKDYRGRPVAGLYVVRNEPDFSADYTNTILMSADSMNALTLLHEVTHAATVMEVAQMTSPEAKQLWSIFQQVKDHDDLAGEYGVDAGIDPNRTKAQQEKDQFFEFVAEIFANREFQGKLHGILAKDGWSFLERAARSVLNMLRKLVGVAPSTSINPATVKLDQLVEAILAPSTRDSIIELGRKRIPDAAASIAADARAMSKNIHDRIYPDYQPTMRTKVMRKLEGLAPTARKVLLAIQPLNVTVDLTKKWEPLHKVARKLEIAIRKQSAQLNEQAEANTYRVGKVANWTKKMMKENPDAVYAFKVLVAESTVAQVDPSLTLAEAQQRYRIEVGTNAQGKKVYALDKDKMEAWRDMQGVWQQLKGVGGDEIYTFMRDTYRGYFNDIQKHLKSHIRGLATDEDGNVNESMAKSLNEMLADMDVIEPYFPLDRQGEFWVSFKSADGKNEYVEAYVSEAERDAAIKELKRDYSQEIDVNSFDPFLKAEIKDFKRVPPASFMNQVKDILDKNKVKPEVKQEISKLFLTSLPEQSLMKSFVRRKGTAGFNFDAFDVFKRRINSMGRQLVHMRSGAELMAIENELRDLTGKDGAKGVKGDPAAIQYIDTLIDSAGFARSNPIPNWSKKLTMAGFHMTLGANISAAVINLSQIPMVMGPYLSGEYGIANTTKAMGSAIKLFTSSGTKRKVKLYDKDGNVYYKDVNGMYGLDNHDWDKMAAGAKDAETAQLARDMKVLVQVANEQGQLNRTSVQDVFDDSSVTDSIGDKVQFWSGWMFHQMERVNRQVGLATAYQLEVAKLREGGKEPTPEQLADAAEKAIDKVELLNGAAQAAAAPPIAQTGLGRVAFLFKRYGVAMYYLMWSMAKGMTTGKPQDRMIAAKQIGLVMAGSAAVAGLHGVPMFGVLAMLWDLFIGEDDEDDFDTMTRKAVGEIGFNGLGNAMTGWDMASRMGLSDLIFRDPYMDADKSKIQVAIEQIGGPVLSLAMGMERGAKKIADGEVARGLEQMLPAAIRNVMKTYRYSDEGALTARRDPIVKDFGVNELVGQLAGFAPSRYTLQSAINTRNARVQKNVSQESSRLRRKLFIALRMGDTYGQAELMREIMEYNRKHPYNAISADSLERSIESHYRTSATMRGGVTVNQRMFSQVMQSDREFSDNITFADLMY